MHPADRLLGHYDRIAGHGKPQFYPISEGGPIAVAIYSSSPKRGMFTAFTVGLSHSHPPDGTHRELTIRIAAGDDLSWALACGFVADQLRDRAAFNCGDTINFQEEISPSSPMNGFVVAHPLFLPKEDMIVDIGVRRVEIVQMIPIFDEERAWLQQAGSVNQFLSELPQGEWLNPRRKSTK